MTYANDCIGMHEQLRLAGLKRITDHTDTELNVAIEAAHRRFGGEFWLLLHGIDAYMERRKRRQRRRQKVLDGFRERLVNEEWDTEHIWGNS